MGQRPQRGFQVDPLAFPLPRHCRPDFRQQAGGAQLNKLGGGPAVTHGICNHPAVIERLEQVAQQLKIPLQHEATSATSGTDTDAIFWTRGGIASGLISLPNRYMHSPVEMVNLRDLEQIPELMAGFALSLKHGEHFKVRI